MSPVYILHPQFFLKGWQEAVSQKRFDHPVAQDFMEYVLLSFFSHAFLSLEKNVETYAWPSGFTVLRLVNALCCAGLPAQLLKEVVLEAIDMGIITSSLVNSVVYFPFKGR